MRREPSSLGSPPICVAECSIVDNTGHERLTVLVIYFHLFGRVRFRAVSTAHTVSFRSEPGISMELRLDCHRETPQAERLALAQDLGQSPGYGEVISIAWRPARDSHRTATEPLVTQDTGHSLYNLLN
jgi:hypothetical protein